MSEFTKGEWKVSSDGTSIFNNISDDPCRNFIIAECNTKNRLFNHSEKRANAQLIAHAPQMLEMLKSYLSFIDEIKAHGIEKWSDEDKLKQLIQQATTIK